MPNLDIAITYQQLVSKIDRAEFRPALRSTLERCLSLTEMRGLCFDLGIDYECLDGNSKSTKVVALLIWFEQHGQLPHLGTWLCHYRPDIVRLLLTS